MNSTEYQNVLNNINQLILGQPIRITSKMAKALMLNNPPIRIGNQSFGLTIKNLGLGVCSVELNTSHNTIFNKK